MSDKADKLKAISTKLNKEAAKRNPDRTEPVCFIAGDRPELLDLGTIPTGNPTIDRLIGGGFPRGTIGMLVGQDGAGKSRAAMDMIAYNQQQDPDFQALYVHLEARGFPVEAAKEAGIDLDRLLILNAQQSGEKTIDAMVEFLFDFDTMTPVGAIDLCVVDSVAAAAPEAELKGVREEGFSKESVARLAAMMSKVCRMISGTGALGRAVLLLINQIRIDIGGYGAPETNPGGKAIGHYPKITVRLTRPGGKENIIKDGEQVIGHTVHVRVVKNNSGKGFPQAEGEYRVRYGQGVDRIGPLVDLAIAREIIEQTSSAWYKITRDGTEAKINGRGKLDGLFEEDPELLAWLEGKVAERVKGAV